MEKGSGEVTINSVFIFFYIKSISRKSSSSIRNRFIHIFCRMEVEVAVHMLTVFCNAQFFFLLTNICHLLFYFSHRRALIGKFSVLRILFYLIVEY